MNTAEKIIQEVQTLPEAQAREVLDFVGFLKSRQQTEKLAARKVALEGLTRFRGRFKAVKFSRDELYDRACLR
jgi:hypothetical protein